MYSYKIEELTEEFLGMNQTRLQGDRREVSILFSGIRSFSTLTENMEPVDVVSLLNEYFEVMSDAVIKHRGTLDKYIGDSIMVTFGAALPLEDHAWMSVQAALEMRSSLQEFNAKLVRAQKPVFQIGIGINADTAIAGNLGSSRLSQFTVIGDAVNIAAYLEGMSKQYGCDIVISKNTYQFCSEQIWARELDYIHTKGRNQPIAIYEVVGLRSEPISEEKQKLMEHYNQGRAHYLNRKFRRAMNEFAIVVEDMNTNDKTSMMYLKRCQYWLQNPPSEDWDGVWTLT
ncbi:adenylate/guanylate cyclase domain-containing protein [Argonema galeatum]|uniref:adenylate/guanylate cyclase domain-containing protein n=1 Tax=Argonema galeatum TaxID=2942762 RepID=UPI0020134770|nr:adenylate/guanylate cyclase domain-containing protein [Argonema galeatum]MCL1466587.1 adenylate/guanylate cyclase domain-containing protein [Argonema galeatum A003/A1]